MYGWPLYLLFQSGPLCELSADVGFVTCHRSATLLSGRSRRSSSVLLPFLPGFLVIAFCFFCIFFFLKKSGWRIVFVGWHEGAVSGCLIMQSFFPWPHSLSVIHTEVGVCVCVRARCSTCPDRHTHRENNIWQYGTDTKVLLPHWEEKHKGLHLIAINSKSLHHRPFHSALEISCSAPSRYSSYI